MPELRQRENRLTAAGLQLTGPRNSAKFFLALFWAKKGHAVLGRQRAFTCTHSYNQVEQTVGRCSRMPWDMHGQRPAAAHAAVP